MTLEQGDRGVAENMNWSLLEAGLAVLQWAGDPAREKIGMRGEGLV